LPFVASRASDAARLAILFAAGTSPRGVFPVHFGPVNRPGLFDLGVSWTRLAAQLAWLGWLHVPPRPKAGRRTEPGRPRKLCRVPKLSLSFRLFFPGRLRLRMTGILCSRVPLISDV
jgi:hypothetical protein